MTEDPRHTRRNGSDPRTAQSRSATSGGGSSRRVLPGLPCAAAHAEGERRAGRRARHRPVNAPSGAAPVAMDSAGRNIPNGGHGSSSSKQYLPRSVTGYVSISTTDRIFAHASARPHAGSNAQNCQLWSLGGLPPAGVHVHFAGVQQSVWDCHGSEPQLDRRLRLWMAFGLRGARIFAAALPRPMYRITCPSRTRLHACSQVLARHHGLMCRIIGHYLVCQ